MSCAYVNKKVRNRSNYRLCRTEFLEERALLSAVPLSNAEYVDLAARYSALDLPAARGDLNVITLDLAEGDDLAALKSAISAAERTVSDDLIVVRTTAEANTLTYTSASDQLLISFDSSEFGTLTIVSLGAAPLTLDAASFCGVLKVSGETTSAALGGLTITGGLTAENGGGIWNEMAELNLTHLKITGNTAYGGAGISCDRGTMNVFNTLICGNAATGICGGITKAAGSMTLTNVTLADNSSASSNAESILNMGSLTIKNSIVLGIVFAVGEDLHVSHTLSTFADWSFGSNFRYDSSRSLFADAANGDYSLAADSQALDCGSNALAVDARGAALTTDLAGNERIAEGTVDLGAYERVVPKFADLRTGNGGTVPASAAWGSWITLSTAVVSNVGEAKTSSNLVEYYAAQDPNQLFTSGILLSRVSVSGLAVGASTSYRQTVSTSSLTAGTWYFGWKVSAYEDDTPENSTGFCETPCQIQKIPLSAPTNIRSTAQTSTSVSLQWNSVGNASGYEIEYSQSPAFENVQTVTGISSVAWTVSGLDVDSVYYFRVKALGAVNWSDSGFAGASVRTLADVTAEEYALICEKYAELALPEAEDAVLPTDRLNIITIKSSDLSVSALKTAISKAARTALPDLIVVRTTDQNHRITYTRAADELTLNQGSSQWGFVSIVSLGSQNLTLDAAQLSRVMNLSWSTDARIGGLTFTGGLLTENFQEGGGISSSGTLTLVNSVVYGNSALSSGGIHSSGTLNLVRSTVTANSATGLFGTCGGIGGSRTVTLSDSIVCQNFSFQSLPNITGSWSGEGNCLGYDPAFVCPPVFDADGQLTNLEAVDLHLRSDSMAIGKGAYELESGRQDEPMPYSAVVNTLNDSFDRTDDEWSLREAIYWAPQFVTITFAPELEGTLTLTRGQLIIDKPLAIDGGGKITIDADRKSRAIQVSTRTTETAVTLAGLRVVNGYTPDYGGGIFCDYGTALEVTNSTIANNTAYRECSGGGGIASSGALSLSRSVLVGNSAYCGGGLSDNGTTLISDSTIAGNSAMDCGGTTRVMTIVRSIVSQNHSENMILNADAEVLEQSRIGGYCPGFVCPPVFDADGQLANPDTVDLHLRSDSPAVGLGAYELESGRQDEPIPYSAVVNTLNDSFDLNDDEWSLREAIYWAPQFVTITFAPELEGTLTLALGQLIIDKPLAIDGGGKITIDADRKSRAFFVESGVADTLVTLRGLRIIHGQHIWGGGGIHCNNSALAVLDSTISECCADVAGGGVNVDMTGTLVVRNSTISDCSAPDGGGINSYGRLIEVSSSIISGNSAQWGGGIAAAGTTGTLSIVNSAVVKNTASECGGIYHMLPATITNSTFADNKASAGDRDDGIYSVRTTLTMSNTIVTDSIGTLDSITNGFNCLTAFTDWTSQEGNLVYDPAQPLFLDAANGNYKLRGVSRAKNGGNSALAVDAEGNLLTTDLAGNDRCSGSRVDIGAYEYQAGTLEQDEYSLIRDRYADLELPESVEELNVIVIDDSNLSMTALKTAIDAAVASEMPDLIVVMTTDENHTVTFAGAEDKLRIDIPFSKFGPLTLVSWGTRPLTIDANQFSCVLGVSGPNTIVNLGGLTITGGNLEEAGGITNMGSTLTLVDSTVTGNTSGLDGAIANHGTLTTINTKITENICEAGAVCNSGTFRAIRTVISRNSAKSDTPVNYSLQNSGTFTAVNSLITNNLAFPDGGGICNSGTISITNSTIAGSADAPANDCFENRGTITACNSIITGQIINVNGEIHGSNNLSPFTDWQSGTGNGLCDSNLSLFVDAASGDYHLAPSLQAIDRGNRLLAVDAEGNALATDLDGKNRCINGVPDIGAYEFVMTEGYAANDFLKLQAFLEQTDSDGIKNGTKINETDYSAADPATWSGCEWETVDGLKYLKKVFWYGENIVGGLNLSACEKLTEFCGTSTRLSALDLSGCTALTQLSCISACLTSLNLSELTALVSLNCSSNQLSSLILPKSSTLTEVFCTDNQIASLDFSDCTALNFLYCYSNPLRSLNLSGCSALEQLDCSGSLLDSLDLSDCSALSMLDCHASQFTTLDLSQNDALTTLYCWCPDLRMVQLAEAAAGKIGINLYDNSNTRWTFQNHAGTVLGTTELSYHARFTISELPAKATNEAGTQSIDFIDRIRTLDAPLLAPPAISDSMVSCSWSSIGNASGYVLEFKQSSARNWTAIALTGTSVGFSAEAGTAYEIRVRATGTVCYQDSPFSAPLQIRTKEKLTSAEYAQIRGQYADFELPALNGSAIPTDRIHLIVLNSSDLSVEALKAAVVEAASTELPDLIIVRTTDENHTIAWEDAADELLIDFDSTRFGSAAIVSLGSKDLTLDANQLTRGVTISGENTVVCLGGLTITNGNATIPDSENTNGGAILCKDAALTLSHSTLTNSTASCGGGLCCENGSVVITNSTISGNLADEGGGIMSSGNLVLFGSALSGNTASGSGGGLCCNVGTADVTNARITANSAASGGGICSWDALTVCNSLIAENQAVGAGSLGGGIFAWAETLITNATLIGNSAVGEGNGICSANGSFTVNNSILADEIYVPGGAIQGANNLSLPMTWTAGSNNSVYDSTRPLFEDAENGDFRLLLGSQAFGAGSNELALAAGLTYASKDLEGMPRIYDGIIDLGAFECCTVSTPITMNVPEMGRLTAANRFNRFYSFAIDAATEISFSLLQGNWDGLSVSLIGSGLSRGLTRDANELTLQEAGTYYLRIQGTESSEMTYAFQLNQAAAEELTVGTPFQGSIAAGRFSKLFQVTTSETAILHFLMETDSREARNEIYVKKGTAPTRSSYDFAAADGTPSPSLVLEQAVPGTYYVLVCSDYCPTLTTYSLTVETITLQIENCAQTGGSAESLELLISGFGFDEMTSVCAVNSETGEVISAESTVLTKNGQLAVCFDAALPAGDYTLRLVKGEETVDSPQPFSWSGSQTSGLFVELATNLIVPKGLYSLACRESCNIIYAEYTNQNDFAIAAPLLHLTAKNADGNENAILTMDVTQVRQTIPRSTTSVPDGFSSELFFVGNGATPGVLQPGESVRVPIYWRGWIGEMETVTFALEVLAQDDSTAVHWADVLFPTLSIAEKENCSDFISFLQTQFGDRWGEYVTFLSRAVTEHFQSTGERLTDLLRTHELAYDSIRQAFLSQGGDAAQIPVGAADFTEGIPWETGTHNSLEERRSIDPNEILGPKGVGEAGWTIAEETLAYQINFENDALATAPAQRVDVEMLLDSDLDWSTFRFTGFGWSDVFETLGNGSCSIHKVIETSVMPFGETTKVPISVEVTAEIDLLSGRVRASFQTLRLTDLGGALANEILLAPTDVNVGFLLPSVKGEDGENADSRGDGFLTYTVRKKKDSTTGTEIRSVANIQFDFGEIIATNQIDPHDPTKGTDPSKECLLTLDVTAPAAVLDSLEETTQKKSVMLNWAGSDVGSGVAHYDLYVSRNGGNWQLIADSLTENSYEYQFPTGNSVYSFKVVATDSVGLVEEAQSAEVSIRCGSIAEILTCITTSETPLDSHVVSANETPINEWSTFNLEFWCLSEGNQIFEIAYDSSRFSLDETNVRKPDGVEVAFGESVTANGVTTLSVGLTLTEDYVPSETSTLLAALKFTPTNSKSTIAAGEHSDWVLSVDGTAKETDVFSVPYDLNDDGAVEIMDLVQFARLFNKTSDVTASNYQANAWKADFNSDGTVNILDLVFFARNFSATPAKAASVRYAPTYAPADLTPAPEPTQAASEPTQAAPEPTQAAAIPPQLADFVMEDFFDDERDEDDDFLLAGTVKKWKFDFN